jgi:dimethylaniline monooxygenase (N-oxide forming)
MADEFGIEKWSDITGNMFHEYLERYAEKFDLLKRCQFDTEVFNIESHGKGWNLNTIMDSIPKTLTCDVLVMATGICSTPFMPSIDMSSFEGLVLHPKDLQKRKDDLLSDSIKTVADVGGNKSSLESASACAMEGKTVHWLIRDDGAICHRMATCRDWTL